MKTVSNRFFAAGCVLITLAASAYLLTPADADPDLWGHLQFGRDVVQNGLPATTTYSFTADGYRWINHENLSEIAMAWLDDMVGMYWLQWLKCLFGVAVVATCLGRCWRRGEDVFAACLLAAFVTLNLQCHWTLRPQLASFACFTLLLLLLDHALPRPGSVAGNEAFARHLQSRLPWLWWSVPLMLIWTNSHGGFVAGYAVFFVYAAGRTIEYMELHLTPQFRWLRRLGLIVAATSAVSLVNPYSWRLGIWLWESLRVPRPEISEWHGLQWTDPQSWLFSGLAITWGIVAIHRRRFLDRTHLLLMALLLWQAMTHQRHIAFFAIQFGLWYGRDFAATLRDLRGAGAEIVFGSDLRKPTQYLATLGLIVAAAGVLSLTNRRVSNFGVSRSSYPVSALQFIADQQIEGKMVVTFNWAQYVIGAMGAKSAHDDGIRVGFDGRFRTCYPQALVDSHFDFVLGDLPGKRYRSPSAPPLDGTRVLRIADPELVLLDRLQPHSEQIMHQCGDQWVLLYQDDRAQLWGRSDRFDRPTSPHFLAADRRQLSVIPQQGRVAWPAFPVYPVPSRNVSHQGT